MTPLEYTATLVAACVAVWFCWTRVRRCFVGDTRGRGGLVCKSHRAPITAPTRLSPTFARSRTHEQETS